MNKNNKLYIKRALIVFPIILVLAGTTLLGAFSGGFMNEKSPKETAMAGKNIEDVINDDKALKILDIHENLNSYLNKEVVLEGYFIPTNANEKVFGVEVPLENSEMTMTSLTYKLSDSSLSKDIKETDLVKATGKITSFEQTHEDEEKGDHAHILPQFNIEKIEVIR